MFMETLFLLGTFITFYSAATQRSYILMMILSLEATSLMMALMYSVWGAPLSEDYLGIVVLTFAAAETAAALALLTTLTRLSGNELLSSCTFSNYNSVPGMLDIIDADIMGL